MSTIEPTSGLAFLAVRLAFLLGTAVIAPVTLAESAGAWCLSDSDQVNVQGESLNAGSSARGVKSSFLSPNADADCGIVRSIYVLAPGSSDDFAEVGLFEWWSADLPNPFVAWNGDSGYDDWDASYTVDENVSYGFRVQDENANYNWGAYFTGAFLHATGPLAFNKGIPGTNGESDSPNDPAFADFDNLGWCSATGCTTWKAFNVDCYLDNDPTAHFDRAGTNHNYVLSGQSTDGCAGAT